MHRESPRIGIIDSGINPHHPHVVPVAGGVSMVPGLSPHDYIDRLGHGTAVAGAIREKAPDAELWAVKVFDRCLVASGSQLLEALAWCLDHKMNFINLSLGTLNTSYVAAFAKLGARAAQLGTKIISAYEMNGQLSLPGSLAGFEAVSLDDGCSRENFRREQRDGRTIYLASGFPRDAPGIPREKNLRGISFAVANVTGLLAAGAASGLE